LLLPARTRQHVSFDYTTQHLSFDGDVNFRLRDESLFVVVSPVHIFSRHVLTRLPDVRFGDAGIRQAFQTLSGFYSAVVLSTYAPVPCSLRGRRPIPNWSSLQCHRCRRHRDAGTAEYDSRTPTCATATFELRVYYYEEYSLLAVFGLYP
jgi:hypothetical protein